MDKKLTDKEIIKALDSYKKDIGCAKCGFKDKYLFIVIENTLDLINRLQAENKKLQNTLDDVLDREPLLVERAEKYAKAEAYKEFAELSIKRICEQVSAPTPSESYIVEKCNQTIDNLLKEKIGE